MKKTHYEVRHDEGTERRLTLREARLAYDDTVDWFASTVGKQAGPVIIVKVTVEEVPLRKGRKR